ncbi:IPExxxVDY family protein [Flavobacterium rhizosphaerae]|uniref:IPExxxVDY family protein n=1 Tax=Flavobacterium rhizosphaerae TaxID=3163298 RepID=A0ABW8YY98_9FLAO
MAVHKLVFDDFLTVDYGLIAIHSSIEDYRLAYFINRELELRLEKSADIHCKIPAGDSCFSRYIFMDESTDCSWNLIQNKNVIARSGADATSLFHEGGLSFTTTAYLMPELKKVDYILKVENPHTPTMLDETVKKLLSFQHISTAYKPDVHTLKYKNNLIF